VEEWAEFAKDKEVDGPPFVVSAQIDRACYANTLIDTGCTTYGLVSLHFVQKHQLERIKIRPRPLRGFDGPSPGQIEEVARFSLDIGGNYQPCVYLYIGEYHTTTKFRVFQITFKSSEIWNTLSLQA
jgi:hypothetical protein